MNDEQAIQLKPVVRFREFPFGVILDPSMRDAMNAAPWEEQDRILGYLRSGYIFTRPFGADLTDRFDPSAKANPLVDGQPVGGTTEMTDGAWVWHAGLIYFIERYNVRVPDEFVRHAAAQHWQIDAEPLRSRRFEWSYFQPTTALV